MRIDFSWAIHHLVCDECTLWLHLTLDVMHLLGWSVLWLVKMGRTQASDWLREVIILTYIDASFLPVNRCNKVQQGRFRQGKIFYVIYRNSNSYLIICYNLTPLLLKMDFWIQGQFNTPRLPQGSRCWQLHSLVTSLIWLQSIAARPVTSPHHLSEAGQTFCQRMWMWITQGQVQNIEENTELVSISIKFTDSFADTARTDLWITRQNTNSYP